MRVLVTGASGFLGRDVVRELGAQGIEVHAQSRKGVNLADNAGIWHAADLLDRTDIQLCHYLKPTHLLHLAWDTTPGYLRSASNLAWLEASARLFSSFWENGGRRLVGVGTCAEYARSNDQLVEDQSRIEPATLYGATKAALGLICTRGLPELGVSTAWARVFYLFGPRERPQRIVPMLIQTAQCKGTLSVHESDIRDYLDVREAARGLAHLLTSDLTGAVNVASGVGISIRELADAVAAVMGLGESLIEQQNPAEGEASRVVADISRLVASGWSPRLDLPSALRRAVEYWLNQDQQ